MSTQATRGNGPADQVQAGPARESADPAEVGQVMGQLMADLAATSGMLLTLVGVRIGLWESLAAGPASPGELAARSSASEPYVREWLRSQAAAGYVRYEPATGYFSLPQAVAAVMAGKPLRAWSRGLGCRRRRSGRKWPATRRRSAPGAGSAGTSTARPIPAAWT